MKSNSTKESHRRRRRRLRADYAFSSDYRGRTRARAREPFEESETCSFNYSASIKCVDGILWLLVLLLVLVVHTIIIIIISERECNQIRCSSAHGFIGDQLSSKRKVNDFPVGGDAIDCLHNG